MGLVGLLAENEIRFSNLRKHMKMRRNLAVIMGLLTALPLAAQFSPSTGDIWDVNQGAILILSTDLATADGMANPYDMRDIFGGTFGAYSPEKGNVVFANGKSEGFVNIVEWRTQKPVTVKSFRLFANDDPDTGDHGFGTFRLWAKSTGSFTFDTLLFTFTPTHPYKYEDTPNFLLSAANVKPVEAQEFKAEFTTWNGKSGAGANGPRIVELDGSAAAIEMKPEIRVSETEISWTSAPGVTYQIQYREKIGDSVWQNVSLPLVGTGARITVSDYAPAGSAERYYRVVTLD
jgi:hypothetical protein